MTPAPAQATKLPEPQRFLQLTTPAMHGEDVGVLQTSLRTTHNQHYVKTDKVYGPMTKHAVGVVATAMGLDVYVATPYAQKVIEGITGRTPAQILRAKQRAEAAAKAGSGLAAVLAHAVRFLGVAEHPPGSNGGEPEPAGWIRDRGYTPGTAASTGPPWCDCFASSMVILAGGHIPSGEDSGYVPQSVANAKAGLGGYESFIAWNGDLSRVKPGMPVAYAWDGSHSGGDHIGIVRVAPTSSSGTLQDISGNTSGTNASDGGMVAYATRSMTDVVGFLIPRF